MRSFFFFFNDTATTEIYTLSLHDALPISTPRCGPEYFFRRRRNPAHPAIRRFRRCRAQSRRLSCTCSRRSEEHTSELQSQSNLVCRLLLEKKKNIQKPSLLFTRYLTYNAH